MSLEVIDKPSDSFRILHTADWHLGKLLGNQSREEEHKRFLDWLLKVVNNNKVDTIILARIVSIIFDIYEKVFNRYLQNSFQKLLWNSVFRKHGHLPGSMFFFLGSLKLMEFLIF